MPARRVCLLLFLLSAPAFSQHSSTIQARIDAKVAQHEQQISQAATSPAPDVRAERLAAFQHDVSELSTLSSSVQSDLQKLQHGMLVKDLDQNLKKLEKLSKKVRHEIE